MKTDELRILILEDIPEEGNLIERMMLRDNLKFTSLRVDSRETFEEGLDKFDPDIVLSDHALPRFNSIEALKICREKKPAIPFILVTGTVSEEFAVNCIKQGADDYLLKSNLTRLPSAIKAAINHRHTQAMKKRAEDEIKSQNEQLRASIAELKKSNAELDNLVYSVSHNLRGPVSTIQGLVYLAKLENRNHEEIFDMVMSSVMRLDDTIKEITNYSRNTRIEINPELVNLRSLIDQTLEQLEFHRHGFNVRLNINLTEEQLVCDRFRLALILNNLISNSLKYADHSKEVMMVEIACRRAGDRHVEIVVEDNGIGVRPDVMPFVYNMFYRGTEKSDGAGLGLYIVKEAVDRLGGTITLKSEQFKGTSAIVTLPAEVAVHEERQRHTVNQWSTPK